LTQSETAAKEEGKELTHVYKKHNLLRG